MINALAIFIGGGLGAISRYFVSMSMKANDLQFPFATLGVNILGSFILGFVTALFWKNEAMSHTLKIAITVGFCGGFTTFSTFSWETFDLIKNGEYLLAFLYTIISVLVCVLAVSLGAFLSKYV